MFMNRKLVHGLLAVATGTVVGCSAATLPTSSERTHSSTTTPTVVAPTFSAADSEESLTPQEEGLPGPGMRTIQQYGYGNVWFPGRRCRWYWVPSSWGDGPYESYWGTGRWVRVCGARYIPWWWYGGPEWDSFGAYSIAPRFRPSFPRAYFNRFPRHGFGGRGGMGDRDRGGMGDRDRGGMGDRDRGGETPGGGGGGGGGGMGGRGGGMPGGGGGGMPGGGGGGGMPGGNNPT